MKIVSISLPTMEYARVAAESIPTIMLDVICMLNIEFFLSRASYNVTFRNNKRSVTLELFIEQ
jgi:hypothetical protein